MHKNAQTTQYCTKKLIDRTILHKKCKKSNIRPIIWYYLIVFDSIRFYLFFRLSLLFVLCFTNTNNEPNFVIPFGYKYRPNTQIKTNIQIGFWIFAQAYTVLHKKRTILHCSFIWFGLEAHAFLHFWNLCS